MMNGGCRSSPVQISQLYRRSVVSVARSSGRHRCNNSPLIHSFLAPAPPRSFLPLLFSSPPRLALPPRHVPDGRRCLDRLAPLRLPCPRGHRMKPAGRRLAAAPVSAAMLRAREVSFGSMHVLARSSKFIF